MNRPLYAICFALVVVLAGGLRTWRLGERPMHADEANQAMKLGALLESGDYRFDPRDHHGPTLYYAGWVVARLGGRSNAAELTEATVRVTTAIAGVAAVMLLMALARPMGGDASLGAGLLLAVAPASVYYSRYFIQESLLVTFALGTCVCATRWNAGRHVAWAVAAGVGAGLMLATKASAPLLLAAAGIAALAAGWRPRPGDARALGVFLAVAAIVAALLYSSFGRHWAGLRDAFMTFGYMAERATQGAGHEKPWYYYLQIHVAHRAGGVWWDQSVFLLLALGGAMVAWVRPGAAGASLARWAAVMFALVAVAMSVVPYKTPWQVVNLMPWLALLAAAAAGWMRSRVAATALVVVMTGWLGWQTWLATVRFPADERNPYAYVHTSPDAARVTALVANLPPDAMVRVIGREYWPLPWYLRARAAHVGYWETAPADCEAALVICSAEEAPAVRARLRGNYREGFLGLRPGVLLITFAATATE